MWNGVLIIIIIIFPVALAYVNDFACHEAMREIMKQQCSQGLK